MSVSDSLSIGWTRAAADRRRRAFRLLLALDLVVTVIGGALALVAPAWSAGLLGLPSSPDGDGWIRLAGALAILVAMLQLPLYVEPTRARVLGLGSMLARLALAVLLALLGGGFVWLAVYPAVMGLLLLFSYRSYGVAELMTRP
jgi:hypothetical protein